MVDECRGVSCFVVDVECLVDESVVLVGIEDDVGGCVEGDVVLEVLWGVGMLGRYVEVGRIEGNV